MSNRQLGRYKLEKRLGEGAYAEVYKATDTTLDRAVALKVLKPEISRDETALARFIQEAKALANLIHPHIAWVWDVGQAEGRYYLAMRYVEGQPLDALLAARGPLPWDEALGLTRQVAEALAFAHEQGFAHRDVKPGNILVSETEGAVLTDFGLVKALDASGLTMTLTTTKGLIGLGTPHYMAPEQWEGQGGPAADQYALACVLCEMLSGEKLFAGDTPVALMKRHVMDAPELPEAVPAVAREAVLRALEKDPAARFETVKAFVEALIADRRLPPAARHRQSAIANLQSAIENLKSKTLTLAPGVTLDLVYIPPGPFLMGSDKSVDKDADDDETPQHEVHLEGYWIGKYPVTVAQFAAFVEATGYETTAEKEGGGIVYTGDDLGWVETAYWMFPYGLNSGLFQTLNHPVTQVSWDDALAFCEWASRVTGERVTLPSEAEWEKAARGAPAPPLSPPKSGGMKGGARLYPWGDAPPTAKLCNFDMNVGDTTPVGRYSPQGDSPYGCADMAGNVWEWTRSLKKDYPYDPADGREDPESRGKRVLRGGSFDSAAGVVRCAYRGASGPDYRSVDHGFRVVVFPSGGTPYI